MTSAEVAVCWVHSFMDPVPTLFLHEHHRHPRAFGGGNEEDNLVWLCVQCHDTLHRLATMAASGKKGLVEDYLDIILPNNVAARERLKTLVTEVLDAKTTFHESVKSDDSEIIMSLRVPRFIHSGLKALALGHTHDNGRPVGLYAYAVKVLQDHVLSQGFTRKKEKEEEEEEPKEQASIFTDF